jgi:hypothetical protein
LAQYMLYGTTACHLCELAQEMLLSQQNAGSVFTFDTVDISESEDLFQCYGLVIPVLRHADGRELNWPFSKEQLALFLAY